MESWDPDTRVSSVDPTYFGSATYIRADEDGAGGYLLTNYHIVKDGDVYSALWLDGTEMDLELVGYDDGTDIAVMRFEDPAPEGVEPIPLGDSDALQIGELAICIGNPGAAREVLYGTVTAGIISGLQREDINAGNFQPVHQRHPDRRAHQQRQLRRRAAQRPGRAGGHPHPQDGTDL